MKAAGLKQYVDVALSVLLLLYCCGHTQGINNSLLVHICNILPYYHQGAVLISPPGMVSVCNGDELDLTCTITGPILVWSFNLIPESATSPVRYELAISFSSPSDQTLYLMVNSTKFTISRVSAQSTSPLVSRLLINPVSNYLNETVVNCTDITSETTSIMIFIINGDLIHGI